MTEMTPLRRALAGAISLLLVTSVGYALAEFRLGADRNYYRVSVVLGELGQGVVRGTDVKMRGVIVGSVGEIDLNEDYQAVAELVLEPPHEVPRDATFAVTGKTLLGEKQIEVRFDGPVGAGPMLARGSVVSDPSRVIEFENVLATLTDLLAAIDPDDLGTVVNDFFGAFAGMGPDIARSIDQGARAAAVFAGSLDDQVAGNRDLSLVAESLGGAGEDFNRLGREVERGMPTLSENRAEIVRLLDELAGFSRTLDATLRITRADLDRMMVHGDNVTRLLYSWRRQLGEIFPSGIITYSSGFEEGFTHEGITGQAARFEIIVDTGFDDLCDGLPPELAVHLPGCDARQADDGAPQVHSSAPEMLVPLPGDIAVPDVPERLGADEILRRSVRDLLGAGDDPQPRSIRRVRGGAR